MRNYKIIFIFILVFGLHLVYFRFANSSCLPGDIKWFTHYLNLQEYYLGFSYSISIAFAVFAFIKFNTCKGKSIGAGIGASAWAIALWTLGCFLVGCCGSPMWIVYLNLFGISVLKVPKWSIAMISALMVIIGYFWLKKELSRCCSKSDAK